MTKFRLLNVNSEEQKNDLSRMCRFVCFHMNMDWAKICHSCQSADYGQLAYRRCLNHTFHHLPYRHEDILTKPMPYDEEIAMTICARPSEGVSLAEFCAEEGSPSRRTINRRVAVESNAVMPIPLKSKPTPRIRWGRLL